MDERTRSSPITAIKCKGPFPDKPPEPEVEIDFCSSPNILSSTAIQPAISIPAVMPQDPRHITNADDRVPEDSAKQDMKPGQIALKVHVKEVDPVSEDPSHLAMLFPSQLSDFPMSQDADLTPRTRQAAPPLATPTPAIPLEDMHCGFMTGNMKRVPPPSKKSLAKA